MTPGSRFRFALRGTSLRLALLNLVLALGIASLLAGVIYLLTIRVLEAEVQDTVRAELQGLAEQFRRDGYPALLGAIRGRVAGADTDAVYLLGDGSGRSIAGNLDAWPPTIRTDGSWQTLSLYRQNAREPTLVGLRAFVLPGGTRLLVGRDMRARRALSELVTRSLLGVAVIAAVLMFVVGQLLSRLLVRRIAAVTRTSDRIVDGNLAERVPVSGNDDEFDRLAQALNRMLDRIEVLMTGMRAVTDSLAHDLKRPLTRLRSGLELAQRKAVTGDADVELLERALGDVDGLLRTFNALLEIARAETGLEQQHFTRIDLCELVTSLVDVYTPLMEERRLALDVDLRPETSLRGHRELLTQAIANLFENAARFAPSGSRIEVAVAAHADRIELVVADHGPGIPAADRERVLERFVRLDDARSVDGAGLGLSLVAAVARLHGAALGLRDNGPGLRVVMAFPIERPCASERSADRIDQPGRAGIDEKPAPHLVHYVAEGDSGVGIAKT